MMLIIGAVKKRRIKEAGFTLLELIIVITIVAILAGISTPLFRRTYNELLLSESVTRFTSLINYARQKAVLERNEYRLNLDAGEGKYWLTHKVQEDKRADFKRLSGRSGRIYFVPGGIKIDGQKEFITFYPDGRSERLEFSLTCGTKTYIVKTKGITGYVTVKGKEGD